MMPIESSSACSLAFVFGALARLVALVEQFDLLQFLEGFRELRLGVFELGAQIVDRALEILAPLVRRLGIGRIGEMGGIVDTGALLLGLDFALEVGAHALELGDHGLDLCGPAALLVHLELPQPDQRLT